MRREKRTNINLSLFSVILFGMVLTACGARGEAVAVADHARRQGIIIPDIDLEKELQESMSEENAVSDVASVDEESEPTPNDDGSMEIYLGREIISLSDDVIMGQVTVEDILQGNPILYDRFKADNFVFEWIISDDEYDDNMFLEDGVLVISKEDDAENTQVIHVQAEGGYATWISFKDKFEYMDVNFDDVPDLLICSGHHGNQGAITYYCFLQTDTGFVEAPTFTDIPNPAVDAENKLILSQWRNSATSHSWAEFKYKDNAYALSRELREDEAPFREGQDANEYIWVWTINGEEIGRSDELSEIEIADLLYSENSEWRIADDRWRTIYNKGLTIDGSIYNTP